MSEIVSVVNRIVDEHREKQIGHCMRVITSITEPMPVRQNAFKRMRILIGSRSPETPLTNRGACNG